MTLESEPKPYSWYVQELKYRTGLRIAMNMAEGMEDGPSPDQMIGWTRPHLWRYLRQWGFKWYDDELIWK